MQNIQKLKVYNHQTDEYEFSEDQIPEQYQSDSDTPSISEENKKDRVNNFLSALQSKSQKHNRKNQKGIQKLNKFSSNYNSAKIENDEDIQILENRNQGQIIKQSTSIQIDSLCKKIEKRNTKINKLNKINSELRKKQQQLSQNNTNLNKDLEQLKQDNISYQEKAIKYFNKQFNKQLFKDINTKISQKNQDYDNLLKEYQNIKCQYDQLVNFVNSINSESQIYFQQQVHPQFFQQISEYLLSIKSEMESYRQFAQSLIYECESYFSQQLNNNTFQDIKKAQQKEIETLQHKHKLQIANLKAQNDKDEKELLDSQGKTKILQQKLQTSEQMIKKLQIEIAEQEEFIKKSNNNQIWSEQEQTQNLKDKIKKQQEEIKRLELEQKNNYMVEINKNTQMKLENNQLKYEIQEMQNDCDGLKVLLAQSGEAIEVIKKQLQNSKKINQELNGQLFQLQLNQNIIQEQIKQKNEDFQQIFQENQNNKLYYFDKQQESKNKIIQLEKENDDQLIQLKQQETDIELMKNQLNYFQKLQQEKQNELGEIIQSIDNYKIKQNIAEQNHLKENNSLKLNINFIISKMQPKQKVDQVIPLIQMLSENLQDNEIDQIDPFDDLDIMIQEDKCKILEIQWNEQLLIDIIQNNHPPNFEELFQINEKVKKIGVQRSINANETSSFFNGYFIKNMTSSKKLYFVREEKTYDQIDSFQQLKNQLGHAQLLQAFITAFNKQLEQNNLMFPNIQLPPTMCIKILGSTKYFYCERLIQNKENNTQKFLVYINALKYYSYYYTNGVYMITDVHVYGNYLYDAIISSTLGVLSSYDQGPNEIAKQKEALNTARFDYENYRQLMQEMEQ